MLQSHPLFPVGSHAEGTDENEGFSDLQRRLAQTEGRIGNLKNAFPGPMLGNKAPECRSTGNIKICGTRSMSLDQAIWQNAYVVIFDFNLHCLRAICMNELRQFINTRIGRVCPEASCVINNDHMASLWTPKYVC